MCTEQRVLDSWVDKWSVVTARSRVERRSRHTRLANSWCRIGRGIAALTCSRVREQRRGETKTRRWPRSVWRCAAEPRPAMLLYRNAVCMWGLTERWRGGTHGDTTSRSVRLCPHDVTAISCSGPMGDGDGRPKNVPLYAVTVDRHHNITLCAQVRTTRRP